MRAYQEASGVGHPKVDLRVWHLNPVHIVDRYFALVFDQGTLSMRFEIVRFVEYPSLFA